MERFLRLFDLVTPVLENLRLAQTTGNAIFIDDERMIITHAQPRAFFDTTAARQFDGRRFVKRMPRIEHWIYDSLVIAPFLIVCSIFSANGYGATGPAQHIDQANLLHTQVIPPKLAVLARPRSEVKPPVTMIETVEDQIMPLPILRALCAESLKTDRTFTVRR